MNTLSTLTLERIEEIKKMTPNYDDDCPKLTKEQIKKIKPLHPENFDSNIGKHNSATK